MRTGRQFRVDRGGTPTDIVARRPDSRYALTTFGGDEAGPVVRPYAMRAAATSGGGGYGPPSPHPHQAGEEIDDLRAF